MLLLFCFSTTVYTADLQLFNAGKKAFSVGLYTIALENLYGYLDSSEGDKNEDDAVYLCGVSNFYLKDFNKSISYFNGLQNDFPKSPYIKNTYYWLGLNNYYLKNYKQAIDDLGYSAQKSSYTEISLLYRSLSYLESGDTSSAIDNLKIIIEDSKSRKPYVEEALYRISTLLLEEGKHNRAINYLNIMILDHPESKYYQDALELLGETYFLLKEWNNAKRIYNLLIDEQLGSIGTLYKRLSTVYFKLGDNSESINYLNRYRDEIGYDNEVNNMLIDLYIKDNNQEMAKTLLLELKESLDDNNAYKLGVIYFKEENYKEAFKYFSGINTRESLYYSVLSGLYGKFNVNKFVLELNRLYKNDSYTIDANNRYVNHLEDIKDYVNLEKLLVILIDEYPNNISYNLTLGELYLTTGELDKSIKYLAKGYYEGSEYYSSIAYKLGWIYYNKSEYKRSIEYFNSLKLEDFEFNKALYSKAIAYYSLGDYKNGGDTFRELLNYDSSYKEEVSLYLGLIEKEYGNYEKAISYFTSSALKDDLYTISQENIAWCYYHLEDFKSALDIYLELGENLNAANCYYYLNDYENALELYKDQFNKSDDNRDNFNYRIIEILFFLDRDTEAINWDMDNEIDSSSQILDLAEGYMFNGNYDRSLKILDYIINEYKGNKNSQDAVVTKSKLYYLKEEIQKSIDILADYLKGEDLLSIDSAVDEFVHIVSSLEDLNNVEYVYNSIEEIGYKEYIIPVYIELIRYYITDINIINKITDLINIVTDKSNSDKLILLKSIYYYNQGSYEEAENYLKPLLVRENVDVTVKIESLLLLGDIYSVTDNKSEAVSLYLNIYVNYPGKEEAEISLYRAYTLSKESEDKTQMKKIKNILNSEYKDSIWTKKVNSEN